MERLTLEKFLRFNSKNIHYEKCVLFLGPLFGATTVVKDGKEVEVPIHEHIRASLNDYYSKEFEKEGAKYQESKYLDCQFDNLFIVKNVREGKPLNMTIHRQLLQEMYQSLKPTAMYEQIARLPLNAIITCTPDPLLRNAFEKIDHDFFYYSPKGQRDKPKERFTAPVIYNLFGSAGDPDSFITTHEAFFNFVFTMLGGNIELPIPLRSVIKNASLFITLGFDLNKWYIPLIIRRLNEYRDGTNKDERESIFNKAAEYKDDDDDDEKLSAKILLLDVASPSEVFNPLLIELERQKRLRPISAALPKPKPSAPARALIEDDKLKEAIRLLIDLFKDNQTGKNELSTLAGNLATVDSQKDLGILDDQKYLQNRAGIRVALLNMCDEIDQNAAVEAV